MKNQLQNILFVQFFTSLFIKRKKLFCFFLLFFIVQIFLTAIKLEVTPFFLYGMFSEQTPYTGKVTDRLIFIDNREIRSFSLSNAQLTLLTVDLENYLIMKRNKGVDVVQSRVESKYPRFTNSFIYPLVKNRIYNTPSSLLQFEGWFKNQCRQAIQMPVGHIKVVENTYAFDQAHLSFNLLTSETVALF